MSFDMNLNYNQKNRINCADSLCLIIKSNSVEFAIPLDSYHEIDKNIYLDHFPYLILFSKIPENSDLRESIKYARELIIRAIRREIIHLSSTDYLKNSKEILVKLKLLAQSEKKILECATSL